MIDKSKRMASINVQQEDKIMKINSPASAELSNVTAENTTGITEINNAIISFIILFPPLYLHLISARNLVSKVINVAIVPIKAIKHSKEISMPLKAAST